jgi:hypothetical protein
MIKFTTNQPTLWSATTATTTEKPAVVQLLQDLPTLHRTWSISRVTSYKYLTNMSYLILFIYILF